VLGDVGQRLGDDEVGGRLDGGGAPSGHLDLRPAGHRAVRGQPRQGAREAPVGEDRRQDAPGHAAQFGQGLLGGRLGAFQEFVRAGRVPGHHPAGGAEQDGDGHHPVLRAVVQRPLDAPQFGGVGVQRGGPGRGQLGDPQRQVGSGTGGQQAPPGVPLEPRHTRAEAQDDGRPAEAEQRHGGGLRPGAGGAEPQRGAGGVGGRQRPQQREEGVPDGGDREADAEQPEQQAEGGVPQQPAQFPPGGGVGERLPRPHRRRIGRHHLGPGAGQPCALPPGQGVQRPGQHGGEEQAHAQRRGQHGEDQQEQDGQRPHGGAEPAGELGERGTRVPYGPHRDRPGTGARAGCRGRAPGRHQLSSFAHRP
jgi:hypothetical protein